MAVGVGSLLRPNDIADAAIPKLRLRLPHDCQFIFTDTTVRQSRGLLLARAGRML
jgi:hypothetical protein